MDLSNIAHLIESNEDCNCSICEQAILDDYGTACNNACQCCEEVEVPEDYKALPTEIVGGSSYICGGRRVRKVKRRKHRSKKGGYVIGGKRKAKHSNPYIRFVKKHGSALRKKHPNASPQAIMKALAKMYREQ